MTRIQRSWTVAAVLAGALFACIVALAIGGSTPSAPTLTLALAALALFVFAARNALRP